MKNIFLLFVSFFTIILFYGCEKKDGSPLPEKLDFVDLRKIVQAPFVIIDDSVSMTTTVKFKDQAIFSATWEQGIYSGPIIKTRLLWARSESNLNFIIIGSSDLFYKQLIVIKVDGTVCSYKIGIINLLKSELRENETLIWFKYNNSWIRAGQVNDSEIQVLL